MAYTPSASAVGKPPKNYSLADVQLTGGRQLTMTITASPSVLGYLLGDMKETKFLNLYNDVEALAIAQSEIVAIKLTAITKGE